MAEGENGAETSESDYFKLMLLVKDGLESFRYQMSKCDIYSCALTFADTELYFGLARLFARKLGVDSLTL